MAISDNEFVPDMNGKTVIVPVPTAASALLLQKSWQSGPLASCLLFAMRPKENRSRIQSVE
jgi:hypothetical protein